MYKPNEYSRKSTLGRLLGTTAAALLCLTVCGQSDIAAAAPPHAAGGGSHGGGGVHAGAPGFHGAEVHTGGGSHGAVAASHPGFGGARVAQWSHGFNGDHHWAGGGVGWTFGVVPYDGYYGYGSPVAAPATWYYCSDPPGYYPYVTQCYSGWQTVPAG